MIRRQIGVLGAAAVLVLAYARVSAAQESMRSATAEAGTAKREDSSTADGLPKKDDRSKTSQASRAGLPGRFVVDQKEMWTSPTRIRFSDAQWLVPLGGLTASLLVTDRDFSKHLSQSPTTITRYKTISDAGVAAMIGGAGGMWVLGHANHNEHWSETGFLAGESVLNSFVAVEGLKYSLGRERPFQGNGSGAFFQSGSTSFPSSHAAAAWSVAGVIAHEYPSPFTKVMAYGLASLVTVSRVKARQHFPSDVLVGSVLGDLVGQSIYSRHHDADLGGGEWRSVGEFFRGDKELSPDDYGTPYVSLENWVYPALDRITAQGLINAGFAGMKPWTRLECARLVQDARDSVDEDKEGAAEAEELVHALESEFSEELKVLQGGSNSRLRVESVYSRMMEISGKPLADSYHFGQTIGDDYGRPYQEGFNNVSGFSGYATAGRYSIYVRGEYQRAPSAPAYSLAVRQAIAIMDSNPLQSATPISTMNQVRLLDSYAGVNVENWEFTVGKQSLWWGPSVGGAMLMSNNAEPFLMFRGRRTIARELPWFLHYMGPTKAEFFLGRLEGNQFPPRPLLQGIKVTIKPSENLEMALSRTSEFGGVGRALTFAALFNSYFSWKSSDAYRSNDNPGKRTIGFNFSYKIPWLRNWLTLYTDGLLSEANNTQSDPSTNPLNAPRRSALHPGIYLPRVPGLPKLDVRLEAVNTNPPTARSVRGQYVYWNDHYHDLYTNNGNLIGDWIGREGMGFQGWSTYWFSPRNSLQFGYRHAKVASDFIPGGETVDHGSVKVDWLVRADVSLSAVIQYEQWKVPLLAPGRQTDFMSSIEIIFHPQRLFRRTPPARASKTAGAPNS